jgi:hypothetical protein
MQSWSKMSRQKEVAVVRCLRSFIIPRFLASDHPGARSGTVVQITLVTMVRAIVMAWSARTGMDDYRVGAILRTMTEVATTVADIAQEWATTEATMAEEWITTEAIMVQE